MTPVLYSSNGTVLDVMQLAQKKFVQAFQKKVSEIKVLVIFNKIE